MKLGRARAVRCTAEAMILFLLGISPGHGQSAPSASAEKPLLAEDVFKNVQVLRGIPVKEFMDAMGFFSASLGMTCTDCHVAQSASSWGRYADDTPLKKTARRMVVMVNAINQADFGGRRRITCYTCHAGYQSPQMVPSLAQQYGPPPPEDPDEVPPLPHAPKTPTADQILDKYIQALGGAEQLAKLTSFSAQGTYEGFDSNSQTVPVEIFAKAPDERATIVHTTYGNSTTICDGRAAWLAMPVELTPVPVLPLLGGDLEGAKVDAQLSFPGQIKQELNAWRAGFPVTMLDSQLAQVVEATTSDGGRIKLYFDDKSGLLLRQVRYTDTPAGRTPTHIEYSDYRAVAGVQMPFHWRVTWVDGQSTTQLSEVRPNVPIKEAQFAKPAPPAPKVAAR